jgi:HPt (histidine-containing phosphotransfer) domain-containing protein
MSMPPFFDRDIFRELCAELGPEDTAEVLKTFLADTARKIEIMTSAMLDRTTVKREAHSIKSSAATFGFAQLSALARECEAGVEAMNASGLHEFLESFRQVFEKTSDFVRQNLLDAGAETRS